MYLHNPHISHFKNLSKILSQFWDCIFFLYYFMVMPDVSEPFGHLDFDIFYVYYPLATKLGASQMTGDVGRRGGAAGPVSVALCP